MKKKAATGNSPTVVLLGLEFSIPIKL
jgi:hypothetical protein